MAKKIKIPTILHRTELAIRVRMATLPILATSTLLGSRVQAQRARLIFCSYCVQSIPIIS